MSAPVTSTRRLAIAVGTAAASATIAIGVTAASLLGWFSPSNGPTAPEPASQTPMPASSPVILVPVAPAPAANPVGGVQLVMDDGEPRGSYSHDDHERREHGRDHDDDDEEDRDDD